MTSFGWGPEKAYSVSYQVLKIGENSKVVKIFSPQPSINVKNRVKKLGICRCCLLEGQFADINRTHFSFDEKEPYSSMLQFCFDLTLFHYKDEKGLYSAICDACVTRLQDCVKFKRQILKAEDVLKAKYVDVHQGTESHTEPDEDDKIKLEAGIEPYGSDEERGMDATSDLEAAIQTFEVAKSEDLKIEDSSDLDDSESLATVKRKTVRPQMKKEMVEKKRSKTLMSKQNKTTKSVEKTTSQTKSKILANKTDEYRLESSESDGNGNSTKTFRRTMRNLIRHNGHLIIGLSNGTPFKWSTRHYFSCICCKEKFSNLTLLKEHTQKHSVETILSKIYDNRIDYTKTILKIDVTDLKCRLCNNSMTDLKSFRTHLTVAHGKVFNDSPDHIVPYLIHSKIYKCGLCNKIFENFVVLNTHTKSHFGKFVCDICGSVFSDLKCFSIHKKSHIRGKFSCNECGKIVTTQQFLDKHKKQVHENKFLNKCLLCPTVFKYYTQKATHMVKEHGVKKPECKFCGKSYYLKKHVVAHIRRDHKKERNHRCNVCEKVFFESTELKAHMLTHTGAKDFECSMCNKTFGRKSTLSMHMKIHLRQ